MMDELARIRARVGQRRTALARIDELSLQQDLRDWTRGEKAEYQNLNRELNFSAWGQDDVEKLLAIIDAQQAVVDAAAVVDAIAKRLIYGGPHGEADDVLDKLHDALAALKGAGE